MNSNLLQSISILVEQAGKRNLRGKRFRLINSSPPSPLGRREATNVNITRREAMHNYNMKQPNFKFFENVNGKTIGSDVFPSVQVQPN